MNVNTEGAHQLSSEVNRMDRGRGSTRVAHVLLVILSICLYGAQAAVTPCTIEHQVGEPAYTDYTSTVDSNTGYAYMLTNISTQVPCCGIISEWRFSAKADGDLNSHVWRQNVASDFTLIGESQITGITAGTSVTHQVSDKISVKNGDYIGWSSPSGQNDIVSYDLVGAARDGVMSQATTPTMGSDTTWAVMPVNGRKYGFVAYLEPSTAPTFSNLPHLSTDVGTTDTASKSVYTLLYSDADPDDVDSLTLSLATTSEFFELSGDIVHVKASPTAGPHTVDITVTDQCEQSTTETLTIDVTETRTNIVSLPNSAALLREDQSTPAIVLLHDLVYTDDGPLEDVTCRMTTDPDPAPILLRFKEGTSNYSIYFEKNETNPLDYDLNPVIYCNVTCNDGTSDSVTKEFQVSLEPNKDPVFSPPSEIVVSAATTDSGDMVFNASAYVTDTDGGDLTFTMSNLSCCFEMYPHGEIHATESLNSLRITPHIVQVNVSDGYNVVGEITMTIKIVDINYLPHITYPQETLPKYDSVQVDENTGVDYVVYTALGTDDIDDIDDTITWEAKWDSTLGETYFKFNTITGEILTIKNLDFEVICKDVASKTFGIEVRAYDGREYSEEWRHLDIVVRNVNEAPAFRGTVEDYAISTGEGSASDTLPCPLFDAEDPDICSADSLEYTIDCGTPGSFHVTNPAVDCSAIVQMTQEYDLDPDGPAVEVVTCSVTVTDEKGLTDSTTLTIKILEIDDNAPMFVDRQYVFSLSNSSGIGTFFGPCATTDNDYLAVNKQNKYTTDSSTFGLGPDCMFYTRKDMTTVMAARSYTFSATVTDRAGHTDVATITVNLFDTPTTTTTVSTTPLIPDMYDNITNFFDDVGNIAWFVMAMILLALALGLLTYVIFRCCTTPGACGCMRDCHSGPSRRVEQAPNNRAIEEKPRQEKKKSRFRDCFKRNKEPPRPEGHRMWEGWKGEDFRTVNQGYS